jgi:hypothetical protein
VETEVRMAVGCPASATLCVQRGVEQVAKHAVFGISHYTRRAETVMPTDEEATRQCSS